MCGRFANAQPLPEYARSVREQLPPSHPPEPTPDIDDYRPSYNVAPQTRAPVIRRQLASERTTADSADKAERLLLQPMKWGLIRSHNRHPPPSSFGAIKTINARDDTILSSSQGASMWHPLLPAQRCVVFCQGFYEWQKKPLAGRDTAAAAGHEEKVERIPHFVGMADPGHGRTGKDGVERKLMPLAGLWDKVVFQGHEDRPPLYTFTIITTSVNDQLDFLHDRMPVILPDAHSIATWLGLGQGDKEDTWTPEVARLLRPLKKPLECYKVPREVGRVGNDDPGFILPIESRRDGLKAFFSKQQQAKQGPAKSGHDDRAPDDAVKKEEKDDRDEASTSSFERAAVEVTQEVEEDAQMADAAAQAEQEIRDRELAEELQRQWQEDDAKGAASTSSQPSAIDRGIGGGDATREDEIEAKEVGDGFAVPRPETTGKRRRRSSSDSVGAEASSPSPTPLPPPEASAAAAAAATTPDQDACDHDATIKKEEGSCEGEGGGSSRFSPDPFDPPASPPRPLGGYSREGTTSASATPRKRTKFTTRILSPPRKPNEPGPLDQLIERQRRNSAAAPHPPRPPLPPSSSSSSSSTTTTTTSVQRSPTRRRNPPKSPKQGQSPDQRGTGKAAGAGSKDIRAFFAPKS
ncbi:uncharacterized protein PSFLO_05264 [Pseudozyma flocculosa]|uniref:DUF159-domain-containing protein n=2 Tax=Pseudozyma flocculosa TaxID=84751 RepID=A0A5C3F5K4_9BASI|nr:uncharacterized protein PSFLO_05264 [Pseudozyma flocculosa]